MLDAWPDLYLVQMPGSDLFPHSSLDLMGCRLQLLTCIMYYYVLLGAYIADLGLWGVLCSKSVMCHEFHHFHMHVGAMRLGEGCAHITPSRERPRSAIWRRSDPAKGRARCHRCSSSCSC